MLNLKDALLDVGQLLRLCALVVLILLFNSLEVWRLWLGAWKDWSHVPVFFCATGMLLQALAPWLHARTSLNLFRVALVAAFALGVGAAIEGVQPWFGRDRSLLDLGYDAVGILLALLCFRPVRTRLRYMALTFALTALGLSLVRPLYFTHVLWLQYQALPVLLDAQSPWAQFSITSSGDAVLQSTPAPDLDSDLNEELWFAVNIKSGAYPGIVMQEFYPDWRLYEHVVLELLLEGPQAQTLVLRIDDLAHNNAYDDRFNRRLRLTPGWNRIRIPLQEIRQAPQGREADLAQINRLLLFAASPLEPFTFHLKQLRLE